MHLEGLGLFDTPIFAPRDVLAIGKIGTIPERSACPVQAEKGRPQLKAGLHRVRVCVRLRGICGVLNSFQ